MAKRVSGHTVMKVTIDDQIDRYVVHFTGKSGRRDTIYVGFPRSMARSVDSPGAIDDAARAAISFLLDEGKGVFDEGDFAWGSDGPHVSRR